MATPSSLLSEDQFLCSICLDVLTQPVAIPCGHNFCMACIRTHWDSNDLCQCPMCKKTYDRRPALITNTFISEMATQFKKSVQATGSDQRPAKPGEVSCDICTETKLQAIKSCLVCLTSYCKTHLEPHQRVASLKKHKLIHPVENPEDRMCKTHERPLELFCRTDQTCVCQFCTQTDHKTHDAVPLEQECEERRTQLRKTGGEVQQMIQERLNKVQKTKLSVEIIKRNAAKEISDSVGIFSALVRSIERCQAELIKVIDKKQKTAEKLAEGFIKDLEKEITELQRRSTDLEQLSHTEDHLHFIQSFPSLSAPPHTKDWSEIRVHSDLSVGTAVSHLAETLRKEMEKLSGVNLKMMQQYAVDVTVDPDTAQSNLSLSKKGKQIRLVNQNKNLPDNPERFNRTLNVLGKQGFSSGRFYYEVQVKGKTDWILGVARESIDRKGSTTWSPLGGLWTVHQAGESLQAHAGPDVLLYLRNKPQKVGVFVDYEEGQVSFYDVEARSPIYSYTGCTFTEKLYPFFNPCANEKGKNAAPLIITPVNLL